MFSFHLLLNCGLRCDPPLASTPVELQRVPCQTHRRKIDWQTDVGFAVSSCGLYRQSRFCTSRSGNQRYHSSCTKLQFRRIFITTLEICRCSGRGSSSDDNYSNNNRRLSIVARGTYGPRRVARADGLVQRDSLSEHDRSSTVVYSMVMFTH